VYDADERCYFAFLFHFVSLSRKHFRDTINDFAFYRILASLPENNFVTKHKNKSISTKTRCGQVHLFEDVDWVRVTPSQLQLLENKLRARQIDIVFQFKPRLVCYFVLMLR